MFEWKENIANRIQPFLSPGEEDGLTTGDDLHSVPSLAGDYYFYGQQYC